MATLLSLNPWAVLAATVLAFVLGGLWYGPLFGKAWINAVGKTEDDIKPTPAPFIISFVTALITATLLAWLIAALGLTGPLQGLGMGLAAGLGFIATAMASDSAFCGWGIKLFLIQSGYRVLYSALMGALLGAWP